MIVTTRNIRSVLSILGIAKELAIDTETTGLRPYHDSRMFSFIIADHCQAYYFNFQDYPGLPPEQNLNGASRGELFDIERTWYLHNAKFDLAMLRKFGIELRGTIHDTMAISRIADSALLPNQFSLDSCAKRIGAAKDDGVRRWLLQNKCYTEERIQGKKTRKKNYHFDRVPFDLIVPYAEQDALVTKELALAQLAELRLIYGVHREQRFKGDLEDIVNNERELTRTLFEMESRGVKIDKKFCEDAVASLTAKQNMLASDFAATTGVDFHESPLLFKKLFAAEKQVYGDPTPTGKVNPSFDSDVLAGFNHPMAKIVLEHRKAKSDLNFFLGFLYEADLQQVIHTTFNQHGTTTGRMSSSNCNLQNLVKDEGEALNQAWVVRRAIVPRKDCVFHMIDYQAMEYRLMLDYASFYADKHDKEGVNALIAKVMAGFDVHQATADIAGVSRRDAKTTNFCILYGGGLATLSGRLGCDVVEAGRIRDSVFRAAPEVGSLIRGTTNTAEKRGYIINWLGRRCRFPDAKYSYRATNHLIQGGCADIVKLAMNRIHRYLAPYQTRMVLQIHDELVFEGPPSEAPVVIPAVKEIMEKAYPHRVLPMICSIEHSHKSLADKVKGIAQ